MIKISLPAQLVLVIVGVLVGGPYVNESIVRACYTFSVLFKDVLAILLPAILFSFVASGILSFKKNAPLILGIMVSLIFVSNACAALVSYIVAHIVAGFMQGPISADGFAAAQVLDPYFALSLKESFLQYLTPERMLISAIVSGLFLSFVQVPVAERAIKKIKSIVEYLLSSFLIPLLPLYVFGFLLEIQYKGIFLALFKQYGSTFIAIVLLQIAYLCWMYLCATNFSIRGAMNAINIALPSYITAFSTMSSTATIPVSVACAEKNTGNRPLADVAMPIMANVHLLGDGISTPMLALITMSIFLGVMPNIATYLMFVFYFCTSMFAVSGIPGGGILVMVPVLKAYLGFTPDMVSIIITLYLLLDSFGTAANVMGDGALVMMVNKVIGKITHR